MFECGVNMAIAFFSMRFSSSSWALRFCNSLICLTNHLKIYFKKKLLIPYQGQSELRYTAYPIFISGKDMPDEAGTGSYRSDEE